MLVEDISYNVYFYNEVDIQEWKEVSKFTYGEEFASKMEEVLENVFNFTDCDFVVIKVKDKIVARALVRTSEGWIYGVIVDKNFRSKGFGSLLIKYIKKHYSDICNLGLSTTNPIMKKIVEREGFTSYHTSIDDYCGKEDTYYRYQK